MVLTSAASGVASLSFAEAVALAAAPIVASVAVVVALAASAP